MHVVILGMNYAPEVTGVAPFTTGLAEHLIEAEHEVTVVASVPHYPQWKVFPEYRRRRQGVETLSGVRLRRTAVFMPRQGSAVQRVIYDSSFALGVLWNCLRLRQPDIVIIVSPPLQAGLVGALFARWWRVPSVLLIKDLPLEAAISVGLMRHGWMHAVGRQLERLVYGLTDHIVLISPAFKRSLAAQGARAKSMSTIPDWANLPEVGWREKDASTREFLGAADGDFLVVYAGNIGQKQGLEAAVNAAMLAGDRDWFKLTLIGDGSAKSGLLSRLADENVSAVKLLPLQPTERLPEILTSADALLICQMPDVLDSVAPSKLLTYMAAGRPIIAAVNAGSEAARLVEQAGCGIVVPPQNPGALLEVISQLREEPARALALGKRGQVFAKTHYSKAQVLKQWDDLFTRLLGARAFLRARTVD